MMDDHRKRIVAMEGTFVLDEATGFYEPEREPAFRHRGLIIIAGAILCWALFLGIAYEAVRAWGAVFG